MSFYAFRMSEITTEIAGKLRLSIKKQLDSLGCKDEANDDDAELLNEQDVLEEDETKNDKELNKKEDIRHVRKSVRKRTQQFEITPEEIGECDDKNDRDYK